MDTDPSRRLIGIAHMLLIGILVYVPIVQPTPHTEGIEEVEREQQQEIKTVVPEMLVHIAWCESRDRHFDDDGNVLRGKKNPQDIGRYQINLYWHQKDAEKMGLDIFDEKDNETYAIHLYNTQGTKPWNWSKWCWGQYK